ncbi:S1C family serine protease [Planctomicrobium piriforme]|uniref:Trypsin-like peptidase domain-containing protein n=1 Tax=Planctomicrobium piriforme TaxID=1576369 RepID=A0A1I3R8Q4_9PLAN|nr:serine protease [Planctomicrobium piriforme]SFJ41781.1 Trypsin-like peptidase domain-containing protein [Planctomicrobium piriforme]
MWSRWNFIALSVHISLAWSPIAIAAEIPREILDRCKNATAMVDIGRGTGSAFCIRGDGLFITNDHVVAAAESPGQIRLILASGEAEQRAVQVRILRRDSENDLALLQTTEKLSHPAIPLGEAAGLHETMTVTTLGYPFGRLMSLKRSDYPSISLNVGRISALRKQAGELKAIQLDGSVNPGNSGGPVVDEKGRVVGMIVSGIRGSGLSLAIPISTLKQFLEQPAMIVNHPSCSYQRRSEPVSIQIETVMFDAKQLPSDIELQFEYPGRPPRIIRAARVGNAFQVTAPIVENIEKDRFYLAFRQGLQWDYVQPKSAGFRFGETDLSWAEVRLIERRGDLHMVTFLNGTRLIGQITDWGTIPQGHLANLDPRAADRLDVVAVDPVVGSVSMHLQAFRNENVIGESDHIIEFTDLPAHLPKDCSLGDSVRSLSTALARIDDAFAPDLDEVEIEANVTGASRLIISKDGFVWQHEHGDKPGQSDADGKYLLINQQRWNLNWSRSTPASETPDISAPFKIRLGPAIWDLAILSVNGDSEQKAGVSMAIVEHSDRSIALQFDKSDQPQRLFRLRLTKQRFGPSGRPGVEQDLRLQPAGPIASEAKHRFANQPDGAQIAISPRSELGYLWGPISKGDSLTFRYVRGTWGPNGKDKPVSPDDSISPLGAEGRLCLAATDRLTGGSEVVATLPDRTRKIPFVWIAPCDLDRLTFRIEDSDGSFSANVGDEVIYQIACSPAPPLGYRSGPIGARGTPIASTLVSAPLVSGLGVLSVAPNLLPDPSFEETNPAAALPPAWGLASAEPEGLDCRTAPWGHTGVRCLQLAHLSGKASVTTPQQPMLPNSRQAVKFWIRGGAFRPETTDFSIDYFDASGKLVGNIVRAFPMERYGAVEKGWTISTALVSPEKFKTAVCYQASVSVTKGEILLDDFALLSLSSSPEHNALWNGGFENTIGEVFYDWVLKLNDAWLVQPQGDSIPPKSGWNRVQIQSESGSAKLTSYVPGATNKTKTLRLTGWHQARVGTGKLKLILFREKEKLKEFIAPQNPGPEWTMAEMKVRPDELGEATHWGVEYEASGKFDIAVDDVRVWTE